MGGDGDGGMPPEPVAAAPAVHLDSADATSALQAEVARLRGVEKACRRYAAEAEAARRREKELHTRLSEEVSAAIAREDGLLRQLRDLHGNVDAEVSGMRQALSDKDEFINSIAAAKHELSSQAAQLQSAAAAKEAESVQLRDLLEASEADLEARVGALSAELDAARVALSDKDELVKQLAEAKQQLAAQVARVGEELDTARSAVQDAKLRAEGSDEQVAAVVVEMRGMRDEADAAARDIERLKAERSLEQSEYERLLGERSAEMEGLATQAASAAGRNADLARQLEAANTELHAAQLVSQEQAGAVFEAESKRLAAAELNEQLQVRVRELTEENDALFDLHDQHEALQQEAGRLRDAYTDTSQMKSEARAMSGRLEEATRAAEISAKEVARLQGLLDEASHVTKRMGVVQAHSRQVEVDGQLLRERVSQLEQQGSTQGMQREGTQDTQDTPLSDSLTCDDVHAHCVPPASPERSPSPQREAGSSTKSRSELVHQLWTLHNSVAKAIKLAMTHHNDLLRASDAAAEHAPGVVCTAFATADRSHKVLSTELRGARGKAVWIISNYLTEVEKLHLGVPMAYFEPDVKVIANLGLAPTRTLDKELKRSGGYDFMKRNYAELVSESRRRQYPIDELDALPPSVVDVKAAKGRRHIVPSVWNLPVDSPPEPYLRSLRQRVRSASPEQAQSDALVFVADRDASPSPTAAGGAAATPSVRDGESNHAASRQSRNTSTAHLIQRLRAQVESRW